VVLIEIQATPMGKDMVFLVTGGDAHIGAVATAYNADENEIIVEVIKLPSHREAELAVELAEKACLFLGCTVTTLVGIHLDHPSKQDIDDIVEETRRKMEQVLSYWK
jgi:NAD(P)-dependent dehydrogenase (short-subunit alcohol dehydrogenase family)